MAICARCGSVDEGGRFCANCGNAVAASGAMGAPTREESALTDPAPSGSTVNLYKGPAPPTVSEPNPYGPVGQLGPVGPGRPPQAPPNQPYPHVGSLPSGISPASAVRSSGRRRGWLIAGAAFIAVVALATTAVLVLQRSTDTSAGLPAVANSAAPQPAGPPETAGAPDPGDSTAPERRAEPPVIGRSATVTSLAASTAPAPITSAAPGPTVADPLAAPGAPIPCGPGYIVQVASELDLPALTAKVAAMSAAQALPAGAKWTDTASSCAIFTSQANVLVIYSGPFASPDAACPARLASPPDAFIKGTTPETAGDYFSCLCPAVPDQLPAITTVGQQGVWVGELQRVLGTALDYDVGSINADPSIGDPGRWGIYTDETAGAVGRFQADTGLAATNQVNAETWSALQSQSC